MSHGPILAKARQVVTYYDRATDCNAIILDRTGRAVKTEGRGIQTQFCDFCRKHPQNFAAERQEEKCSCEKIHHSALAESRLNGKTYIYACDLGFAYWTSPLYQNGWYAGALAAGRVLVHRRGEAEKKFLAGCGDAQAAEKFRKMIEKIPEKNNDEIKAMARLLGICAEKISKRGAGLNAAAGRIISEEEDSLEKERKLLAALRRGDSAVARKIIGEFMSSAFSAKVNSFELGRTKALELLVLLSRAAARGSQGGDAILRANNRNLKLIQKAETMEELTENLHLAAEQMAGKIFSFHGMRHATALRKAQHYIWENFTRKISLREISEFAGLSAPYFCSVFKEEMGENFSSYLNRLRVEKAAALLTETGKSLSVIAGLCGFDDQSWFSRIFKNYTGISPGKYREAGTPLREFRTGGSAYDS